MFELDPRLANDGPLLPQYRSGFQVIVKENKDYPWLILVPTEPNCREIYDLSPDQQQQLWATVGALSQALQRLVAADKMNVASLGNMVSQLHVHIIGRFKTDPAWPNPVWCSPISSGSWLSGSVEAFGEQLYSLLPPV